MTCMFICVWFDITNLYVLIVISGASFTILLYILVTLEQQCEDELLYLLGLAASDVNLLVRLLLRNCVYPSVIAARLLYRLAVYRSLVKYPPFTRKFESKLNTEELVDKLWTQMMLVFCICLLLYVCCYATI